MSHGIHVSLTVSRDNTAKWRMIKKDRDNPHFGRRTGGGDLRQRFAAFAALSAGAFGLLMAGSPAAAQAAAAGSTLTVTWSQNPQTIDPRKIYDGEDWNIGRALYVGLYSDSATFHLQPKVAQGMPKVTDHGLVYTIQLRPGARWSNGQPLTAQDFVYALRTELASSFQSPDTYLWYMIKGASAYEAGKSSYLGVRALGPHTLQYTLSQPYSAFPYVLSVPAAFPVYPAGVKSIASHPVSDGPYVLQSWKTGVSMQLVKNPHYFLPHAYPQSLVFDFNVSPSVGILRVQSGQADLVGDGIPSANYLQLAGNPQTAQNITRGFSPALVMLALNMRVKPFNSLAVREAVQMALDKPYLVRLINGRGQAANGVLPPSLPGFGPDIKPVYPYNPGRARQLLKDAGYPHGFTVQLGLASEQSGGQQIATVVQADLAKIGVKVLVKPLPAEATAIARVPMMTYSWYMDYPDPSDFVNGFATSPAVVGDRTRRSCTILF